jgi:large subunit ribosomal protein L15
MIMSRTKKTKHKKKMGSRTLGKGGIQPGGRGGKGFAGSKRHRFSWIMNFKRDHLGKRGFIHRNAKSVKAINLRVLENIMGDKKEIDLSSMGYDKVLGTGRFSKKAIVKANYFSRQAKEKIEKAGGKAIELMEPKTEEAIEETEVTEETV